MQPDATSESGAHLELTPSGFAALMGAAADAVVIIDRHGSILNFNHAAERLFGYRTQDVVGRNVSLLMTEPDRNSHDGYLRQYLKTGRANIIGIGRRVTARHADGRCMPVELSVGEYSDAGRLYFVGILRDLSERERYERALKESEERLRAREEELQVTLGRAPIGILSIDPDDRILDANQAACELVGYEEAELLRIPYTALLHPDEVENTKLHRIRLLGGDRKTFVVNSRYLHRDGSVVHVVLHCAIIYGADGEPERFIAQLVDRTDQVRAEQEANEARERLARVDRVSTMGEMASGIAHEINQPLSAISSYVQACRRRLDSDHPDIPRLRELLAKADEQSLRAGKIVERIRALIRSQDRLRDRARLDEIVSDSLRLARTDANSRDLDLSITRGDPGLEVIVDSIQVQQVILNLIRNAIEATEANPGHGPTIGVGYAAEPGRDAARVWVRDDGPGVPPDIRETLFDPFVTTKSAGTGMGLSISRSIVIAHGGKLWYEPAEPGTRFLFTIPLAVSSNGDD